MRTRVDAVLFDLDGTLVATMQPWDRCWADSAAPHGHTWTDDDRRGTHGHGDWSHHLARVCGNLPAAQVAEDCVDLMIAEIRTGSVDLVPGADALPAIAADAAATGLVSASPRRFVHAALAHFGLRGHFRTVVTREDQAETKPHPAPYLHAARRLGVAPGHCLAVEDSAAGIRSAHAAGMSVRAVPRWAPEHRPPELDLATHHAPDGAAARRWLSATLG
ncbi:MAG: HAD family phosphatase [Mycobacteriaceae bacterium]|nr:HAD family phosphatase [Mycobacteriaceae bacterium]